jgi:hypothetical protein
MAITVVAAVAPVAMLAWLGRARHTAIGETKPLLLYCAAD